MGKKAKIGKQRKDVFYHRAKEAGYRARAAFKLIQLNKKYSFLGSSRVCIDLCAAPGSWMQVATKFMPVSSVIIGVDLYPIAQIPNTIGIKGDITTEKVRQDLKTNLKTWKADLVLHDGAPNVGQNWLHDAYQQNLLVLHAFKLACEFLQKGGTFVTKVFRSKDHLCLLYVFRKLFKKVEATKPIASRFASAEIFVVCQGYLCPDKVDQQFFDPRSVFEGVENEPTNKINILKPEKRKKKAEGYEEGVTMLFKRTKISEFINSTNFIEILEETNQFEWDNKFAKESDITTTDIIEFCKDIKVVGRKDLRKLLNWRKNIVKEIEESNENIQPMPETEQKSTENEVEKDEIDEELEEIDKVFKEVQELKASQAREEKQKKRRADKKKKQSQEKMNLRLMVPGDPGPQELDSGGLFSLSSLDKVSNVDAVVDQSAEMVVSDEELMETDMPNMISYDKEEDILDEADYPEPNSTIEDKSESEDSDIEGLGFEDKSSKLNNSKKRVSFALDKVLDDTDEQNPLTTDLVGDMKLDRRERKAEKWYGKSDFEEIEDDTIEDYELESAINAHKAKGGVLLEKKTKSAFSDEETGYSSDGSDTSPTSTSKESKSSFQVADCPEPQEKSSVSSDSDISSDEEEERMVVKAKKQKSIKLTPVGLALATKMIHSRKAKRDIIDASWNRHMYGDEDLPDFFAESEKKYNSPQIEVDPADLRMYQDRAKDVNVKTIKKAVEAKARKQRRAKKLLSKSRKKAENITNNMEMTSREKSTELRKIYKKATHVLKPKDKKYVVMKKSFQGKRPRGVKGPCKLVDRRLKKDKRSQALSDKKKGKKKK